jgi:hypothetical protein
MISYSLLECELIADTFVDEILGVLRDGSDFSCGNSDTSKCTFNTFTTDENPPTYSTVVSSANGQELTFTGANLDAYGG